MKNFTILDCNNIDISKELYIEQEAENLNDNKKNGKSEYIRNAMNNNTNNNNTLLVKQPSQESSLKNSLNVDLQNYENEVKSLIVSKDTIFSQEEFSSKPSIRASKVNLNTALFPDLTKSLIILNPNEIHGHFLKKPKKTLRFKGKINSKTKSKNGYGHVTWEDGSILQAYFKNNYAEGYCRFINTPGNSFYSGLYFSNVPYNYGIYTQIEKCITYEGEWIKNDLDGIGIEICKDTSIYQGDFVKCEKHGIGINRWIDDRLYEGEFKNNQIDGVGILTFKKEKIYQGEFKKGRLNGLGIFTWSSGSSYSGYYKDDLKHGFGVFIKKVKPFSLYIGFWCRGKQHGIGELVLEKQEKLFGLWADGKPVMYTSNFAECEKYLEPSQFKYKQFFVDDPKNVLKLFQVFDESLYD